ncbi:hypothetical protein SEA_BROPLEASE_49 [Streptomyces phage BroPlease]|uniref:Uncharacterized protein n=1 Tax=Streptomyces phage phiHau3 TaxID=1204524 RepID=K4HZP4_9CAUD|nr:hypothetical protein phiHau3_50 [Streptomyces phage phiHau3]AFU62027.1 hypothetical protein phiHau3_50 [Streptomyces phage phiHau3]USH44661.1 hypothetical protein SEA_BROPLEASE_49 [Streptomyces phage BroPlease]
MARTDPRRGVDTTTALWRWGDLCGTCAGKGVIWCPICFGFAGCATCRRLCEVACPDCSGGMLEPLRW